MPLLEHTTTKMIIRGQLRVGKIMKKWKWNIIIALIMICINSILVYNALNLYYLYNFTSGLMWLIMYPNWMLIVNALLGIVGIFMSILLYKGKIKIKWFVITTIAIWFIVLKNYYVF